MADLIYLQNASLDGYIEDEQGRFDWSVTDEELFAHLLELLRPFGTYLYGRRLYETMAVWETDPDLAAGSEARAEFAAVWGAADKVVHSTTLEAPWTANTRVERAFDPDAVRALKASASRDLLVGGADLATQALAAGLVDEYHVVVRPVLLGGGKPAALVRADLELVDARQVGGAVSLRYRL